MTIRAAFFDIGETVINESRPWSLLADWLDVPRMTMFAVVGGLIARGQDYRKLVGILRPDLDWNQVVAGFNASVDDRYLAEDLYPDVVPCFQELRKRGHFIGVVGNQPAKRREELEAMNLPANLIATSGGWGVKKPDRSFFERIVGESGFLPGQIVYVGDRVDNDVVPAAEAGLIPVHIVRGPWGFLQQDWPDNAHAKAQLKTLAALPAFLERL